MAPEYVVPSSSIMQPQEESDKDGRRSCRHCHVASSLYLDWSAGDVVCTNCGVVNEQHVCDTGPEWRDFAQDQNDSGNAISTKARCGMVPVDEGRFLGGLEPTRLSKQVFGANHHSSHCSQTDAIRKRLTKTNRKVDVMMVRQYAKALTEAKLSRKVQRKDEYDEHASVMMTTTDVRPDHDLQLDHDEAHALHTHTALVSEKWSLDRAIFLHGTPHEQQQQQHSYPEERQDLLQQLDKSLKTAAADMYCAYTLLQRACRSLDLPQRVSHEATTMLCRYATRRNGFHVKGVSSRISRSNQNQPTTTKEEGMERLREWNKRKQISSLVCALLFLTARHLGWTRSLQEVCNKSSLSDDTNDKNHVLIKTKHACKAIAEIKLAFPDYARSIMTQLYHNNNKNNHNEKHNDDDDTDRFVEHATRTLDLPPVALACIRLLVSEEQTKHNANNNSKSSGTKLAIVCASFTHFVCTAGDTMQRLALQAQQQQQKTHIVRKRKRVTMTGQPPKRIKTDAKSLIIKKDNDDVASSQEDASIDHEKIQKRSPSAKDTAQKNVATTTTTTTTALSFDVFSHDPIPPQDPTAKMEYEMRRMWDAWTEQMTWTRNMTLIESACGVSRNAIGDHYKQHVHPCKHGLLQTLQTCESLRETPLASVLLRNITAAAHLMKSSM